MGCEKGDPVQEIKDILSQMESDIDRHNEALKGMMEKSKETKRKCCRHELFSVPPYVPAFHEPSAFRWKRAGSDRESPQDHSFTVRCKKGEVGEFVGILSRIESHIARESEELEREADDINDLIRKYKKYSDLACTQDQYLRVWIKEGGREQIDGILDDTLDDIISRMESLLACENEELEREVNDMNDMIRKCKECNDCESRQDQYLGMRCKKGEREQIDVIIARIESHRAHENEVLGCLLKESGEMRDEEEIQYYLGTLFQLHHEK